MESKARMSDTIVRFMSRSGLARSYGAVRCGLMSRAVILMYHRVGPHRSPWSRYTISSDDFKSHVRYICTTHNVLPLQELARRLRDREPLPKRTAVVTFDDGYKDVYLYAYPVLREYGVSATVFLPTAFMDGDRPFWWETVEYALSKTAVSDLKTEEFGELRLGSADDRLRSTSSVVDALGNLPDEERDLAVKTLVKRSAVEIPCELGRDSKLSWNEVREMSNGGVDFGAHTHTHRVLARLSIDDVRYEVAKSKKEIESRLNKPVNSFSYPSGLAADFDARTMDVVKENGFECAVTGIPRMISRGTDVYRLGRVSPGRDLHWLKLAVWGLSADIQGVLMR